MTKRLIFRLTRKDFEVTWFRGSGGGGQHRNKHANCCRIKHLASGVISTGQSQRSRAQNQKEAMWGFLKKPQFMLWVSKRVAEIDDGQTVEELVEEQMRPENIRVEAWTAGTWKEIGDDSAE